MATRSDAGYYEENTEMKGEKSTTTTTTTGGGERQNFAQGFSSTGGSNPVDPVAHDRSKTVNYKSGSMQGTVNTERYGPYGTAKVVRSTFNINASNIGNTVIGASGPVHINSKQEIFKKGAQKTDIDIKGGKFQGATIGGSAEYNNQGATFESGKAAGDIQPDAVATKVKEELDGEYFFTPEQVVLKALKTGVDGVDLIKLLDCGYHVMNIAHCLPSASNKRRFMVNTLVQMAGMENEMDTS
uniref:uncharacterized protein LOC100187324 n=1 Tax=Ciona intestinalis TaxID=7719 RepID=UPI000521AD46|nr:uncharacterized protein LOC100187324 [Ciona intestinalis]|eukprot:XP_009861705.1 uncharacterized protein LOC100187324 [Ciona intestinalis]